MAKILSYFHLCPINDEEEFLGLSRDQTKGNVINTLGKNIVINVKVINTNLKIRTPDEGFFSFSVYFTVEQSKANHQLDGIR